MSGWGLRKAGTCFRAEGEGLRNSDSDVLEKKLGYQAWDLGFRGGVAGFGFRFWDRREEATASLVAERAVAAARAVELEGRSSLLLSSVELSGTNIYGP